MPLQKIQLYIVLMFAFSSAFGSPVNWRGRYTDEPDREALTRFRPFPSPWISDLEQGLDFGSGWVLYKQSQNVGTPDIGDDIFAFYLSPRWQVPLVIVEDTGVIQEWQIVSRRFLKKWALPSGTRTAAPTADGTHPRRRVFDGCQRPICQRHATRANCLR